MNSIKKIILINLTIWPSVLFAQIDINYSNQNLEKLINTFKTTESNNKIEAFKLQIAFNENLETIEYIQKKFISKFPNDSISKIHDAPYFKLTTGCYLNKKEAEIQLERINKEFPAAFIFYEKISIAEL